MKNLIFLVSLIVSNTVCKQVALNSDRKEATENVEVKQGVNWKGKYLFKALNKDGLTTSFEITIADINHIVLVYVSDSEKPETYKKLKALVVHPNQIKITFKKEYGDMGFIILKKNNNEFTISGQPIYYINPGNDTRILKKIE
jgi:hypothetical protein